MGPGTIEAKFIPLSMLDQVEKIIIVRKKRGPQIPKVHYKVLPTLCQHPVFNMIITPFIIALQARRYKASLILAYHYVPHYYLAYFASIITGLPYILGQTGSDDQRLALRPLMGMFLRITIKKAVCLNVPGTESAKFWRLLGFRKINVLHSSIDTDYYTPSESPKKYDFIYIGRLEDYKGVQKIIMAMKELTHKYPKLTLAVVGYGSLEDYLKQLTVNLGLTNNVSFHGFQQDIRAWLHQSRIFVMASDCEGLPCALMEAMSCGMVCISSLVGNIPDIIQDGETGFGFESHDQAMLAKKMMHVYENELQLEKLKIEARHLIIKEHSFASVIALWKKELRTIGGIGEA